MKFQAKHCSIWSKLMNEVAEKVLRHRTHHCGVATHTHKHRHTFTYNEHINLFPSNVFRNVNASGRLICVRSRLWCKYKDAFAIYLNSGLSSMLFHCPSSHYCISLCSMLFTQIERKFSIFRKILNRIGFFILLRSLTLLPRSFPIFFPNWFCLCVSAKWFLSLIPEIAKRKCTSIC